MLRTFRFQETDRIAYDLMEGAVWAELLSYFQATRGCADPLAVLDYLDTDLRWLWIMDRTAPLPQSQPEPRGSSEAIVSKHVAVGPLADAQTVAEVEAYAWPDPARWVPPDFAQARQRWPDHALVFLPGWRPLFWGTCEAFGVEAALTNLIAEPALFEAAVRCIHERYMDGLARGLQAARGYCDICWLGDDFSSQQAMLLRPEHWRRFIKPYLAEQVQLARSHGLYVLYHSCGAVRPVLPDLIDIGINGLLVFQTKARGMDAQSIARDFGGRLVFYGGMDVQYLLSFGSTEEVWAEVQANMQAFSRCGGYVVANSHHRVATISGRNIEEMCRAARQVSDLSQPSSEDA